MNDQEKTREKLINEFVELRQRVCDLENRANLLAVKIEPDDEQPVFQMQTYDRDQMGIEKEVAFVQQFGNRETATEGGRTPRND